MKIQASMQTLAARGMKYGLKMKAASKQTSKLPWAGIDMDRGEEYYHGNMRDTEATPGLFSMDQYEHTSARDDEDIAEQEDMDDVNNNGENDEFKHGDNTLLNDN